MTPTQEKSFQAQAHDVRGDSMRHSKMVKKQVGSKLTGRQVAKFCLWG